MLFSVVYIGEDAYACMHVCVCVCVCVCFLPKQHTRIVLMFIIPTSLSYSDVTYN